MNDLKKKTVSGLLYKFAERVSVQAVGFIVSIILARILLPEEFGVITLVTVFIAILDVFVTYGFGNSLVVNKRSDDIDFSTCFHFGLILGIVVYIGVWFASPYISLYFENADLTPIIRVMALRIPMGAINSVQHAYVSKLMIFKKFFISTSIGTVISGLLAVLMAIMGCGVWSLVAQYLGNVLLDTVFLCFIVKWHPKLVFSFSSLKSIYDYGWKILIVGLVDTFYGQMRNFVIAKKFTTADLAYYGKGLSFPNMGMSAIEPTIDGVIFPALSNCNDDKAMMKAITRRMIKSTTYVIFPLIIGLLVVGRPLIILLLTDKWVESVIYLQICCLALMFRPVQIINNCVIRASGNSALLLKLDLLKKSVGVALLFLSIPYGVVAVAFSLVIVNLFSTIVNIWPNRSILEYGYKEQLRDILPNLILSVIMGVSVYFIDMLELPDVATLLLQVIIGVFVYLMLSFISKSESFIYFYNKIRKL